MGLLDFFRASASSDRHSSRRFSLPHSFTFQKRTESIASQYPTVDDITDADSILPSLGSIQQYRIVKALGSGSTAVVQLGRHESYYRELQNNESDSVSEYVALKIYNTSILRRMRDIKRVGKQVIVSTALDQVQLEIAIMKKLTHPNVLHLIQVLDDDSGTLVLVLEYAQYGQIMHWDSSHQVYRMSAQMQALRSENDNQIESDSDRFSESEVRTFFRQILLGLEYLHENSICHRDLKPENILLTSVSTCKIADFGVARFFQNTESSRDGIVTSTAGTYAFMSPEIVRGGEYSAYAADVWALGVTLYALVFNKVPYYHENAVTLFEKIANDPIGLDLSMPISGSLRQLLNGMLKKDPEERWTLKQCKEHIWVVDGMEIKLKETFLTVEVEPVEVNEIDIENAVTKVASLKVMAQVKMHASQWRRKARAMKEERERAQMEEEEIYKVEEVF